MYYQQGLLPERKHHPKWNDSTNTKDISWITNANGHALYETKTFKTGPKNKTQIYAPYKYTPQTKCFQSLVGFFNGQVGQYKQKENVVRQGRI